MNDIKEIWESFIKKVSGNKNLKDLIEKLKNGKATYEDAQKYSSSFANYLVSYLSSENPSDSKKILEILMNTNICKNFFNEVDDYTYSMQKALNEANHIALNAVKVVSPRQLIDSNLLLSNDYKKDIENMSNKVELSANKHIDTVQQANAKFQSQAGYGITVSRTYDGNGLSDGRTCKWCLERVGSNIPYDEAYKKGMFQRHEGCHCVIEYNNSGERSYQSSSGGRESWASQQDWMGKHSVEINNKKISVYDSKKYANIKVQTNSATSQKVARISNEIINVQNKYGTVDEIVILKNSSLGGIAAYDHAENILYLSEELGNTKTFNKIVNSKKFPATNLDEVLEHELGGHKAHWDSIKSFSEEKGIPISLAKEELESKLRKYVVSQVAYDPNYIQNVVSKNASDGFYIKKELNETIADAKVKIRQGSLNDENLKELILEVINYDGKHS